MAVGSKTTFKSYIDATKEEPLISFDDVDTVDQRDNSAAAPDTARAGGRPVDDHESPTPGSVVEEVEPLETGGSSAADSAAKLCGYLNKYKIGGRGIGKIFKKRWFVFVDSSCKLLYFRTPEDIVPLGEIDVSNASFNLEISQDGSNSSGKENVFEIRCVDKTVALEAPDAQTRMYWLKQLQSRRRRYSKRRTELLKEEQQSVRSVQEPCAGLIGKERALSSSGEHGPEWLLLDPGDLPADSIGDASASKGAGNLTDLSITNWKTEIRNALATLRGKRQSDIMEGSVLASPVEEKMPSFPEEPISPPSPTSPDAKSKSPSSPNLKESRFSHFKKRLSPGSPRPKSLPAEEGSSDMYEQKYRQVQAVLANQKEEMAVMEEELTAHRELVTVLQRQVNVLQRSKISRQEMETCVDENEKMTLLEQRDKQIVELQHLLAEIQEEREVVSAKLRENVSELGSLKDQVNMYQRSVSAKDETIMSLTNKIFELECNTGQSTPAQRSLSSLHLAELEKLEAAVDAYRIQNQFLNKEILELTQLRSDDEAREKQLFIKSTEAQAKYYQIESKYLLCLDQLRVPVRGGEESRSDEFVSQLLQDALDASGGETTNSQPSTARNRLTTYDQFGFSLLPQGATNDLVAHAHTLQRKSEELQVKDVDKEISINVRWENFLVSAGSRVLQPSHDLKNLIRLGVPTQHREKIWNSCVNFRVGKLREKFGAKYYHKLLDQLSKMNRINPASKQIELDLLRTLPNNKHYETRSAEGVPKLRRVLLAYTQHNPEIGYCQGLNRLAAIALLFLNEEDAFWCLVCIIEFIMPQEYYTTTLLAAQVDQRVLKDVIQDKLPRLHSHLETNNVDLSLFTFNWFLTVFVDNIPVNTYLRIWDTFLYEGNKVLFRFAVAFFKYREDAILAQNGNMAIHRYLRELGDNATDIDRISQIAFSELNPFPMKSIASKRQTHQQLVRAELAELDAIRSEFRTSNRRRRDHVELVSDDDV